MSNRLKAQSSPYLLQHAENPVDWYPWCDEAFEKARREDKPIFLSIGYSTCHWCHVMAHESFENREIAEILNQCFVSIKVDREERPDIDSVYMSVCQALTGSGGWPMSIFMTAEQKPFYAGTYFPPKSRYGMTGFRELLQAIGKQWKENRNALLESADQILFYIGADQTSEQGKREMGGENEFTDRLPRQAAELFAQSFDRQYGGFGSAPKFPTPHNLLFLTLFSQIYQDTHALEQVEITLENMRRGGIFDQIGYGFSRYSTDTYFLVPHFEKMLYDNALLIMAYSAVYNVRNRKAAAQHSGHQLEKGIAMENGSADNDIFLDTAEKTAEYILREMTGPEGEFYSAQDADSEGEEGKFYVWNYHEICAILGEKRGKVFCEHFGVTKQGNFEGKNIPNLLNGEEITDDFEKERKLLYEYRKSRAKLHLDDKVLTSWNSLMICAMAALYRVTGEKKYLSAAERANKFVEEKLSEGPALYVSWRDGMRSVKGFLDEYAYYTAALLWLYEAASDVSYLLRAKQICREAMVQFEDKNAGGYFLYGTENDSLIMRPKETYDGALPSGNSVMAYCLVRLSQITEEEEYQEAARRQLEFLSAEAEKYPTGHSLFLLALLQYLNPAEKITVVLAEGDRKEDVLEKLRSLPLNARIKVAEEATEEYRLLNGKTTYYICKDWKCLPPVNEM